MGIEGVVEMLMCCRGYRSGEEKFSVNKILRRTVSSVAGTRKIILRTTVRLIYKIRFKDPSHQMALM